MQKSKLNWLHRITITLTLIFLVVPVIGTFLYSLTNDWTTTFFPKSYTIEHYTNLIHDQRFWASFGRSIVVIFISLLISLVVIVPVVFLVYFAFPRLKVVMEAIILLPFAVPPVVTAVGLLNIWSSSPIPILNSQYILWGTYFVITIPFVYRSLANNLEGIAIKDLFDAAHLLGATTTKAFFYIILPSLRKGILISVCLCFSMLLGEFVFANLLAGSSYETLQIYLNQKRWENTHIASAIVMSYFIATLIFTLIALKLSKSKHS